MPRNETNGPPPAFVRQLAKAVKKAKTQVVKNAVKSIENSRPRPDHIDLLIRSIKAISHMDVTKEIVESFGSVIPRPVQLEWERASKAHSAGIVEKSKNSQTTAKINTTLAKLKTKIRQNKSVVSSSKSLENILLAQKRDNRRKRKRDRSQEEENLHECGLESCTAKFSSQQAKKAHQFRRHAHCLDDIEIANTDEKEELEEHNDNVNSTKKKEYIDQGNEIEADPFAALEDTRRKKKKNRMGQRERRRQAILEQSRLRKEAINRGEKPPEFKVIIIPGKKRGMGKDTRALNTAPEEKTPEEEEVLHPSWQAKKKEQSISAVKFTGNKIKFDSDDEGA
eukprot:CAMPEP_0184019370 /NCGR_PEP_ID=MMETSP0954-20121128/8715_1 /TAXON_ID=627963 /ORGANISM="Aplanochytrium sp, Strain PBS07" /LENGTH=337 /DNA_ID=CAMNT_0026301031 /DNA_START=85 /DNA_END=1098 /DNA_ORIENTATION=+